MSLTDMDRFEDIRATPDIRAIVSTVAQATRVPATEILGHSRRPRIVAARHLAWFIAHREGMSLADIGRATRRDHTTIMHGVRRETDRRAQA